MNPNVISFGGSMFPGQTTPAGGQNIADTTSLINWLLLKQIPWINIVPVSSITAGNGSTTANYSDYYDVRGYGLIEVQTDNGGDGTAEVHMQATMYPPAVNGVAAPLGGSAPAGDYLWTDLGALSTGLTQYTAPFGMVRFYYKTGPTDAITPHLIFTAVGNASAVV